MSLLTHVRKVIVETLLSPRYREFIEGFSEVKIREHVQKHVFAPADPADYFFSTVVCVTIYPIPDDNNHDFWFDASERVRTESYDAWFEALCVGQMGVVHEFKREKKLDAIIAASSQEHRSRFDAGLQATLERYDIRSPIEQVFYASWECVRERLWCQQGSFANRFLWRFQLQPQNVLYREPKEKPEHLHTHAYEEWSEHRKRGAVYRVDFALVELDTAVFLAVRNCSTP